MTDIVKNVGETQAGIRQEFYNKAMMKMKYILGGTGVMPNSLIDQVFNH